MLRPCRVRGVPLPFPQVIKLAMDATPALIIIRVDFEDKPKGGVVSLDLDTTVTMVTVAVVYFDDATDQGSINTARASPPPPPPPPPNTRIHIRAPARTRTRAPRTPTFLLFCKSQNM